MRLVSIYLPIRITDDEVSNPRSGQEVYDKVQRARMEYKKEVASYSTSSKYKSTALNGNTNGCSETCIL
jgi:hypothetical protein